MKNPIYINDAAMIAAVDSFTSQESAHFFEKKNEAWISRISNVKKEQLQAILIDMVATKYLSIFV